MVIIIGDSTVITTLSFMTPGGDGVGTPGGGTELAGVADGALTTPTGLDIMTAFTMVGAIIMLDQTAHTPVIFRLAPEQIHIIAEML